MLPLNVLAPPPPVPMESAVIYEVNFRAFAPEYGFRAVARRIPAIRALGATVLWLMPVQPVGKLRSAGGLGSPYAVADYNRLNPEFGTEADFRALLASARRAGMRVILDWVANHTAWDNPWIKAHPDWYTRDSSGAIVSPAGTNWNDVADLNYDRPELRKAMIGAMEGWVRRYGVDGFRTDTADYLPFSFWKEAIARLRAASKKPLLMLAEGARRDHYAAGFDLTYGWPFYAALQKAMAGGSARLLADAARQEALGTPTGSRRLRFTSNHDEMAWQGTPAEKFGGEAGARVAFAISALYDGTPLVYNGQEIGWNRRIPIFERSVLDWNSGGRTRLDMTRVLALRRLHASLRAGTTLDLSTDDAAIFRRRSGADDDLIAANLRSRPLRVNLPPRSGVSGALTLAPYEYRLIPVGRRASPR